MSVHYQQTPYTNRRSDMSEKYEVPRRKPTRREESARSSEGTMMSTASTGRASAATQATEACSYSKKIVVVGDGGCGKTCLLISYSQGYFPDKYVPTVFENYITYPSHAKTGSVLELALWDTAGQEEYDRLRPLSYPETDLLFVCFAIDCPNSLENVMDKARLSRLRKWYPEVLHFCPYTPLFLVGLKSDLRTKRTCIDLLKTQGLTPVTQEQGQAVAQKMNARYMECSSKEWIGVDEIFTTAIDTVVANDPAYQQSQSRRGSTIPTGGTKKKRRGCKML